MKELTTRQLAVLNFIRTFMKTESMPPTVGEIAARFGVTTSSAFAHIVALQKKGLVTRSSKARSIRVRPTSEIVDSAENCFLIPYYDFGAEGTAGTTFPANGVVAVRLPASCVESIPKEFGMKNDDIAFLAPISQIPPSERKLIVWRDGETGRVGIFSGDEDCAERLPQGNAAAWRPLGVLIAFQRMFSASV